jgi:hypothetical protein
MTRYVEQSSSGRRDGETANGEREAGTVRRERRAVGRVSNRGDLYTSDGRDLIS